MTTGRINQITSLAGDPRGPGRPEAGDDPPGRPNPRRGRISLNGWGARRRPTGVASPGVPGDTSGHPIAPSRLLSAGPHAEIPTTARTGRDGLRHTALGRGARPPRDAGERRITQGGFPRDATKGWVCWPAAKSPQASALPGIQRSQGFRGRDDRPRREGTLRREPTPPVLRNISPAPGEVDGRIWKVVRRVKIRPRARDLPILPPNDLDAATCPSVCRSGCRDSLLPTLVRTQGGRQGKESEGAEGPGGAHGPKIRQLARKGYGEKKDLSSPPVRNTQPYRATPRGPSPFPPRPGAGKTPPRRRPPNPDGWTAPRVPVNWRVQACSTGPLPPLGIRGSLSPARAAVRPRLGRAHDHLHLHPAAPRSHHPSTHPGNWPARRLPPPFHPPLRAGGGTAAIRGPSAAAAGQGDHRRACARAPVGDASRGHRHGITAGAFRLAQSVPPGCLPPGPTALPAVRDPPSWPTFQPGAAGPVASRLSTYSPTPFGGQKCQQALICTKVAGRDILHYGGGPSTAFFPYKVGHPPGPVTHFKRTWSKLCARSTGGSTARPVCTARGNGRIPWGRGGPHEGGAWPAARRSSRPFVDGGRPRRKLASLGRLQSRRTANEPRTAMKEGGWRKKGHRGGKETATARGW
ncbi:hypothetical protein POX_u09935 [Penicillium oxalicum]|nr:hypothetical protein POX_u09935 [Penicillium oxalicum]